MKKQTALQKWVLMNGQSDAVALIIKKTSLSASTVDKIIRGRYPMKPKLDARRALLSLTKITEDELFPLAATRGKAS